MKLKYLSILPHLPLTFRRSLATTLLMDLVRKHLIHYRWIGRTRDLVMKSYAASLRDVAAYLLLSTHLNYLFRRWYSLYLQMIISNSSCQRMYHELDRYTHLQNTNVLFRKSAFLKQP